MDDAQQIKLMERAIIAIDPDAGFSIALDDDGKPVISEWDSEVHTEIPTQEELFDALTGSIDPEQPQWDVAFDRIVNSQISAGLFHHLFAHQDLFAYSILFASMLIVRPMDTARAVDLFQTIIGLASQKGIQIDPSAIQSWNALCDECELPVAMKLGSAA